MMFSSEDFIGSTGCSDLFLIFSTTVIPVIKKNRDVERHLKSFTNTCPIGIILSSHVGCSHTRFQVY
jgi:hypothetical protein